MKPIAYIHSDFPEKFGIPRQSGIAADLPSQIVFVPEYRTRDAIRGIEDFSHLWIIWQFEKAANKSLTVRPPRLGGNVRMGVFATRSPFRPNPIGLSCVKLERVEYTENGPILHVLGADLMDGTAILDIKPYLAYTDSIPYAVGGFADDVYGDKLDAVIPDELIKKVPPEKRKALLTILKQDPRPSYQDDEKRIYGFSFANLQIKFKVCEKILTVTEINEINN